MPVDPDDAIDELEDVLASGLAESEHEGKRARFQSATQLKEGLEYFDRKKRGARPSFAVVSFRKQSQMGKP